MRAILLNADTPTYSMSSLMSILLLYPVLYREEEDSGRESEEGLLSDFFECGHTVAYRALCKSEKHMLVACKLIIKGGGEGVIIRKYSSVYEHGRSSNLLKIKVLAQPHILMICVFIFFFFFFLFSLFWIPFHRHQEKIAKG